MRQQGRWLAISLTGSLLSSCQRHAEHEQAFQPAQPSAGIAGRSEQPVQQEQRAPALAADGGSTVRSEEISQPSADASMALAAGSSASAAGSAQAPASASADGADDSQDAWLMMGFDQRNWYFNPAEHVLSVANAPQLRERWRVSSMGTPTGTPLIAQDKVFITASGGTFALELESGAMLWARSDLGASSAPAYDADALYVQTLSPARMYKLDAATGQTLWGPVDRFEAMDTMGESSPIIADGKVIVGIDNGARELDLDTSMSARSRGGVEAYDAATGRLLWRYFSVPEQGENGASVWSSVSIDLESRCVLATTGNNFTVTGPHSDAFVALDLDSGDQRWITQVRSGDLSLIGSNFEDTQDTDFGANPILAEVAGRKVAAAGDKGSAFWMVDRTTGEIIWSRSGLSASHSSKYGGIFINGAFDGHYFYVAANDAATRTSTLHKLDPQQQGASVWTHALPELTWGTLSLANGLLFVPNNTFVYVLDANSGRELAKLDTGGTIVAGGAAIARGHIVVKSGLGYYDETCKPNDQIICYTAGE